MKILVYLPILLRSCSSLLRASSIPKPTLSSAPYFFRFPDIIRSCISLSRLNFVSFFHFSVAFTRFSVSLIRLFFIWRSSGVSAVKLGV